MQKIDLPIIESLIYSELFFMAAKLRFDATGENENVMLKRKSAKPIASMGYSGKTD